MCPRASPLRASATSATLCAPLAFRGLRQRGARLADRGPDPTSAKAASSLCAAFRLRPCTWVRRRARARVHLSSGALL
eukprot:12349831-Alexandrium_andersonii.AAC.1